jgi:rod shape-determining protein MreD
MAIIYKNLKLQLIKILPLLLLYFLSISEVDTEFSNYFEILSFNLQLIIIYYWMLKFPGFLGNGHVFFSGIINDVVSGLPLGASALSYLVTSFVASYIRNVTVNKSLFTDWFTFLIAIFFSNLFFYSLIGKFSDFDLFYINIFYNAFFTFLLFPVFWLIFNIYIQFMGSVKND